MGKQTFIEINGKKYDAATGKMISGQAVTTPKPMVSVKQGVGVVDGFARRPTRSHSAAAHAKKTTQKSQTLMRKGLNKPASQPKTHASNNAAISKSSLGSSLRRQQTAKSTQKSPSVHKFDNPAARTSIVKKIVNTEPKPAPAHIANASHTAKSTDNRQASKAMIDRALANATSHDQQAPEYTQHVPKKRHSKLRKKLGISRKAASLGSVALAVVLLAGFFAVQNVPNLSMRVAAARAGFEANMPGYQPSGFSFSGPIDYNAGRVTVSFTSNSDERAYSLTQRSSNWTSDALLANYIETEDKQYQTFLDKGRTLYLYDGSNATWVDDGIWYQIEGNSDLSTDQLVRIAASL